MSGPTTQSPPEKPMIGIGLLRVDGRRKVTGAARYAAEFLVPNQPNGQNLAYAVFLGADIARGSIATIDITKAEQADGVVGILTFKNAPRLHDAASVKGVADPKSGSRLVPLQDEHVRFFGQPVALAVARTLEQAQHAASLIEVQYKAEAPSIDFDTATPRHVGNTSHGDAEAAFAQAAAKIEATYDIARENHQPMELHATLAEWQGEKLTLHEKTQGVVNTAEIVAAQFGLKPEDVTVISPFVGGAFGSALRVWPHTIMAAMAARQFKCPVKLILSRRQMVTSVGYRPRSRQKVRLGADANAKLTAIIHEATGETSSFETYVENVLTSTGFLHNCTNVATRYSTVALDTGTPTPMRGPGVSTGLYALESAMDELAYAAGIDPIELRLRNEPDKDLAKNLPFSSRATKECYRIGAQRFGWSKRAAQPGTMRDGHWRLGYGMATATYPSNQDKADVRVIFDIGGTVRVETAASDIGPGTYTSLTQIASDNLGIGIEHITVDLGDTRFPKAPSEGGSKTLATAGSATLAVCRDARQQLAALVGEENVADPPKWRAIFRRQGKRQLVVTGGSATADSREGFSCNAFGAIFAEVAVDADTGQIKVRRLTGVYGLGRIVNPRLTRSQVLGGMMQGIGMALLERTRLDPRFGNPTDGNLADYLIPVCKDAPLVDIVFVNEDDPHVNPLGVKGVGEIALCGIAPAIANAVYHATGKRVRALPILPENLMA
ncbi:MAG TPA: xanthine dehydrogenase family protein molybdopterin-binding subunit [Stellaceae bacterium]|nr:xanthine dehydrogenase family protein molybdopterin-binding subunit [Stellaceae bacterium]